jgi:hypothetical protein
MKHASRIKSISDKTIELLDGSRWEATDISTPVKLPMWMIMDEIEGDDFGIDAHLTNKRRRETLRAALLR